MKLSRLPFILVLFSYLLLGGLYAWFTPAWQAPDEPAHYNYVRQLAAGQLPLMEPSDYNEAFRNAAVSSGFAPEYEISLLTYEDWQPPLYYLLQTPVYWLSGGSLLALRLFSLLLGAGVVVGAYLIGRQLFPQREWLALTTAVFVAFVPQHTAIMASVNNDALAELLIAGIILLLLKSFDAEAQTCAEHSRSRHRGEKTAPLPTSHFSLSTTYFPLLTIGVLLGLGYLTKGTVYPLSFLVAALLLWRYWGNWAGLVRAGLLVFGVALLMGSLWWGRNLVVYEGLDPFATMAHDRAVVGQTRTAEWVADYGLAETVRRFGQTTFNSFWGQFGWMALPMTHPGWLYPLLRLFTGVVVGGLLVEGVRQRGRWRPAVWILLGLVGLAAAVHVGYNLTYVQHQGRYLFPALIPMGVGVAAGLWGWLRPFYYRLPPSNWRLYVPYLLPLGLALALILLNLHAIFRVIVPNL
ncbi:MAG: glycosyltransferase family 39 protein [Chloroflexota bacterium]